MKTMNYDHVKILDTYNIDSAMENYAAASPCCYKRGEEQLVDCPSVLFYIQHSFPYHVALDTITKNLDTDMLNSV